MLNHALRLTFSWIVVAILASCSHSDSISEELEREGFEESRIIGIHVEKRQRLATRQQSEFAQDVLNLLRKAEPGRNILFWDEATVLELSLMIGSTFKSEFLEIKVNTAGDGEATIGRCKPRQFYSPALAKLLTSLPAYQIPNGFLKTRRVAQEYSP